MTTNTKSTSSKSAAPVADERLELILEALAYQAELIQRAQKVDPNNSLEMAKDVIDRSLSRKYGKNQWSVTVPGFINPVTFWSDAVTDSEAIREFEQRFGTRFRKNAQKESDNHAIERVAT